MYKNISEATCSLLSFGSLRSLPIKSPLQEKNKTGGSLPKGWHPWAPATRAAQKHTAAVHPCTHPWHESAQGNIRALHHQGVKNPGPAGVAQVLCTENPFCGSRTHGLPWVPTAWDCAAGAGPPSAYSEVFQGPQGAGSCF